MLELEDPPASFKSVVWKQFRLLVSYKSNGERVVDEDKDSVSALLHC